MLLRPRLMEKYEQKNTTNVQHTSFLIFTGLWPVLESLCHTDALSQLVQLL